MTSKQLTKVTGTLTAGSHYNTLPENLCLCILFKIQYGTVFDDKNHIHGVSGQEQVSPPRTPPPQEICCPLAEVRITCKGRSKWREQINSGSDSDRLSDVNVLTFNRHFSRGDRT